MIVINILLAIVGLFLLFGIIGEKDKNKSNNLTLCFVGIVALIIALN